MKQRSGMRRGEVVGQRSHALDTDGWEGGTRSNEEVAVGSGFVSFVSFVLSVSIG